MKARTSVLLLVVALAIAATLAVLAIRDRTPPRSPEELVPVVWTDARETPMHVLHVGAKKIACTECHAGGPDAGAPPPDSCAKCHEREAKGRHHGGARAGTTCLSCHVFGAGKPILGCGDCHAPGRRDAGAPPLEHHARADLACGACHAVHGEERAVLSDCAGCHAETSAVHGAREVKPPSHPPDAALSFELDAAVLAFVRDAAPSATSAMCIDCHAPHAGEEAARAACERCHANAHPAGHGHASCLTCHEPHRARKADARSCEGCHGDHRTAAAVKGHTACTSCHAPHAPREARASCASACHAGVQTLASTSAPAHARCTSCHDPHRPGAPPALACARCHEATKPSHPPAPASPAHGDRGPCVGCHAPHGSPPPGATASCASCHPSVGGPDHAAHAKGVLCTQCHVPHGFKLAGSTNALCAGCHAREVSSARLGHVACSGCHGPPHAPVARPGCAGCHRQEVATATTGHAQCASCHDAHSGALGKHASCTSCHTSKEKTVHASLPAGCGSCHRAHGPAGVDKPPSCASCHARPKLGGLHAAAGHADCASCHGGHAPPRSDRATCTGSCHAGQRGHQPDAKVCKGCHLFL